MSAAGSGLLRALLRKAGVRRDEIRLVSYRATEWHSLTFAGERHEIAFRIPGSDLMQTTLALIAGLSDEEMDVPGQIVADIWGAATPAFDDDNAVAVRIEALTIEA
ncbi:MAG: hypothetical protein ABIO85_08360 [Sphingomicrobium sp.]